MPNFVESGLDPDCKTLEILGTVLDFDLVNGKEIRYFCCKGCIFKIFWTTVHLDLNFTFEKIFGLWLDLD